jgi:hypothetical protein
MAGFPVVLYGLTFLAEAVGLGLVIGDIHRTGKVLARAANEVEAYPPTKEGRVDLLIRELLGRESQAFLARWLGIGLLTAGILLGTVADVLSVS